MVMIDAFIIMLIIGYKTKSVKIIRDKVTKVSSGYGFVEFDSPDIAKDVLNNLNEKPIQGSKKYYPLFKIKGHFNCVQLLIRQVK